MCAVRRSVTSWPPLFNRASRCMNGSSFGPSQRTSRLSVRESSNVTRGAQSQMRTFSLRTHCSSWGSCGMVVPLPKRTIMYAARCEVSSLCPSPSLPSSVSQEIVLGVATSAWLHQFLVIPLFDICYSPVPVVCSGSQRHSMGRCANSGCIHARALRKSLWRRQHHTLTRHATNNACSGMVLKSDVHDNEFSILNHIQVQQFGLLLLKHWLSERLRASFPCRKGLQEHPPQTPATTSFCAVASSNRTLPTPSLQLSDVAQENVNIADIAQRAQLYWDGYADGGRALELLFLFPLFIFILPMFHSFSFFNVFH